MVTYVKLEGWYMIRDEIRNPYNTTSFASSRD